MTTCPNSAVLLCAAADVDAVNLAVAAVFGDAEDSRNLSRELSADEATITHYGGHAWLTDEEAKLLSQIEGLTMQAVVLDGDPFDNWLVALREQALLEVKPEDVPRKDGDKRVVEVEARKEPVDAARIVTALAAFEAKPIREAPVRTA